MANFQVPQFIDIEDRIFGPLTFKQFVYLAGGAGLSFMEWVYVPSSLKIVSFLLIIPTAGFALALAFYKVNNRPFISVVEAAFKYMLASKLYIWKRTEQKTTAAPTTPTGALPGQPGGGLKIPKLSESKLKDLSWSLDVREKIK